MQNINVTKPFLPPLDEFLPYLDEIWSSRTLSNSGPLVRSLEAELEKYLGVKNVTVFANATLALIAAFNCFGIKGNVITTPYSFIASVNALQWNKLQPVFIDTGSGDVNIDVSKIEEAINNTTGAIFPVHTYGFPCDTNEIDRIAKKHGVKVIYDAAHAFNVSQDGVSILNQGDASVLSFHATKIFHTFEGGCVVYGDDNMREKFESFKNFGLTGDDAASSIGLNAKMSEIHAAIGLAQIKHIDLIIRKRATIAKHYTEILSKVNGIEILNYSGDFEPNYSYYPIKVLENFPLSRDALFKKLNENRVMSRRYFYPLLTDFDAVKKYPNITKPSFPNASELTNQVLCLPIYPDLPLNDVSFIANLISSTKAG